MNIVKKILSLFKSKTCGYAYYYPFLIWTSILLYVNVNGYNYYWFKIKRSGMPIFLIKHSIQFAVHWHSKSVSREMKFQSKTYLCKSGPFSFHNLFGIGGDLDPCLHQVSSYQCTLKG